MVWNQDIAPFLIVVTPQIIRLYSGFLYEHEALAKSSDPECRGILHTAQDFNSAVQFLEDFRAEAIDNGSIWGHWAGRVSPETRVDRRLLASLRELDTWLQSNGIDDPAVSHALIGKYVYLHYLREREILSDRRLARWEIAEAVGVSEDYLSRVFSRELGLSPWDYLNRYRIQRAKELLHRTNDSIRSIELVRVSKPTRVRAFVPVDIRRGAPIPPTLGHQFSMVVVALPVGEDRLMAVPASAVVQQGQLSGLFVVTPEGIARFRLIRTGRSLGDQVEVLSGLPETLAWEVDEWTL